ncbi:MAG: dephospho-CoA kinase [Woeseiaceae bacterium]
MSSSNETRLRIGLTGGIASGKTQVSNRLGELGATIIDTDVIAREVVQKGSSGLAEIAAAFGDHFVTTDGFLDRAKLRAHVFADSAALRTLESITHPRIQTACRKAYDAGEGPYAVFVVPLLTGSPMREWMHRILVIDCSEATQLRRLLARDNESPEQAQQILAAQAGRPARLSIADDVICNNRSLDALNSATERMHHYYSWLAAKTE